MLISGMMALIAPTRSRISRKHVDKKKLKSLVSSNGRAFSAPLHLQAGWSPSPRSPSAFRTHGSRQPLALAWRHALLNLAYRVRALLLLAWIVDRTGGRRERRLKPS